MALDLAPQALKRLAKELATLQTASADGIRVFVNDHNISELHAEIDGPTGTPYEGGVFRMRLCFGQDYPNSPPKGFFMTKIFHPNVSKTGEICVNVLSKDWNADLGLQHVLAVIRCLLIEPFPESALNEEAGRLLLEDYDEYAKYAKLMTSLHAQPAKRPMPLTASGANASHSHTTTEKSREGAGSPAMKKAKPEKKLSTASAKVKKSLKRL